MDRKKIIICADVGFPKGDPGSNRIEFVGKALQNAGFEVCILSHGKVNGETCDENGFAEFNGIKYWNMPTSENSIKRKMEIKIGGSKKLLAKLSEMKIKEDDIVYVYGNNAFFVAPILSYCKKHEIANCIDVVEWHQPYQYKGGVFSIRYHSMNYTFTRLAKKFDYLIAISNCIKEYYEEHHKSILVLPPLTEIKIKKREEKEEQSIIQLIYPGNPITKENIKVMLEALGALEEWQRKRLVFNITGIKEQQLRQYLGHDQIILDNVKDTVIFHGFMEYSDLAELYDSVDYLFFSRYDNLVNKANFPSKIPELMAKGIVPIGNKVGDYYLYLKDGTNAILFEKDDVKDCANALKRVVNNGDSLLEMKNACINCAKNNFDYANWADKLHVFFVGETSEK